jgi:hypothetical protein
VLAGVVAHQRLPVLALHAARLVRAHERASRGQRRFDPVLETTPMITDLEICEPILRS